MTHPSPLPRPRTVPLLLATLSICLALLAPARLAAFFPVKGNQTISFTSSAPAAATVGGPTYTVTATATSGLPVTLTIDATQAGNASYNASPQVQQSFAVAS